MSTASICAPFDTNHLTISKLQPAENNAVLPFYPWGNIEVILVDNFETTVFTKGFRLLTLQLNERSNSINSILLSFAAIMSCVSPFYIDSCFRQLQQVLIQL